MFLTLVDFAVFFVFVHPTEVCPYVLPPLFVPSKGIDKIQLTLPRWCVRLTYGPARPQLLVGYASRSRLKIVRYG